MIFLANKTGGRFLTGKGYAAKDLGKRALITRRHLRFDVKG
jgi:hypothetical protein